MGLGRSSKNFEAFSMYINLHINFFLTHKKNAIDEFIDIQNDLQFTKYQITHFDANVNT